VNQTYYNELKNIPQLNDNEFKIHFIKYKNGNEKSKEIIIKSNLKLAVYFAKKYKNVNQLIDFDDLISEANIGLIQAIEMYDINKEVQFSYYASFWIKKALIDFITSNNLVKQPQNNYPQIEKKIKELEQVLESEINDSILMYNSLFTSHQIDNYFNKPSIVTTLIDIVDEECIEELNLSKYFNNLNNNERLIIEQFYGINQPKLEYKEIAKQLNLSTRRIYQIKNNALKKIKKDYEKSN